MVRTSLGLINGDTRVNTIDESVTVGPACQVRNNIVIVFTDGLYTKGARAHKHRELIRVNTIDESVTVGPVCQVRNNIIVVFTDGLYTKGTRAHIHRELIRARPSD